MKLIKYEFRYKIKLLGFHFYAELIIFVQLLYNHSVNNLNHFFFLKTILVALYAVPMYNDHTRLFLSLFRLCLIYTQGDVIMYGALV